MHTTGTTMEHVTTRNRGVSIPTSLSKMIVVPQPVLDDIITFQLYYMSLKCKPGYKKRVTWVEGQDLKRNIAVVEYMGKYDENPAPHGNTKVTAKEYKRTTQIFCKNLRKKSNIRNLETFTRKWHIQAKTHPSNICATLDSAKIRKYSIRQKSEKGDQIITLQMNWWTFFKWPVENTP